jgi:hypothetical protein
MYNRPKLFFFSLAFSLQLWKELGGMPSKGHSWRLLNGAPHQKGERQ